MPLLLWLDSFDGAICCRVVAKLCNARDDGENCKVECASAVDLRTGTIVQLARSASVLGVHGAMAT